MYGVWCVECEWFRVEREGGRFEANGFEAAGGGNLGRVVMTEMPIGLFGGMGVCSSTSVMG